MLPRTASPPPILVGGNSRRAVRRAARLADGWLPLYNPAEVAASHHSPALDSVAALGALIDMALDTRAATRSSTPFEVVSMPFVPASPGEPGFQPDRVLTHLGELAEIGVTGVVIRGLGREVATRDRQDRGVRTHGDRAVARDDPLDRQSRRGYSGRGGRMAPSCITVIASFPS